MRNKCCSERALTSLQTTKQAIAEHTYFALDVCSRSAHVKERSSVNSRSAKRR